MLSYFGLRVEDRSKILTFCGFRVIVFSEAAAAAARRNDEGARRAVMLPPGNVVGGLIFTMNSAVECRLLTCRYGKRVARQAGMQEE